MDTSNLITAAVFSAFLKCPTKAHLLLIGESSSQAFFTDIEARISSMYKVAAQQRRPSGVGGGGPLDFGQLDSSHDPEAVPSYVDCRTAVYDIAVARKPERHRSQKSSPPPTFLPILFSPWDKLELSDNLLVCFGALALAQATGILADTGSLIYGVGYRHKTVQIADVVTRTRQSIDAISAILRNHEPPPLVLNRHCAVCDFQSRCRGVAINRDDLCLLTAMTGKERAKCSAKGISTITQLSYGYRPRRRRKKPNANSAAKRVAPIAKNDHKLKALAIKKGQIHVVGTPSLKFGGTQVFLDVEGMPDRDFYYLVGLRYECAGEQVEQSFWADGPEDERKIWESCLRTIKRIGNAQIVSYGAYENRFLKQMKARYIHTPEDTEFVDRLIETSVNLVGCIYGKVYFPTFSNSLKEVGPYLGFQWTWRQGSGAAAPLMRRCWELGSDDRSKCDLIGYNVDDCRAAATVADSLMRICTGASDVDVVGVGSLEVGFQRTFGKFESALPEFEKINNAAYWDYQRSKVYARTDKTIRRTVQKSEAKKKNVAVEKEMELKTIPVKCPGCNCTEFQIRQVGSYIAYDLKFMRNGIKRWVVRYRYGRYRCSECRAEITTYTGRSFYGPSLRAFVVYLMIELRLSNKKAAEHISSLFDLPLAHQRAFLMKSAMAEKYAPTYQAILSQIAKGTLIHADETKGVVKGGGHCIWVFASNCSPGVIASSLAYVSASTP